MQRNCMRRRRNHWNPVRKWPSNITLSLDQVQAQMNLIHFRPHPTLLNFQRQRDTLRPAKTWKRSIQSMQNSTIDWKTFSSHLKARWEAQLHNCARTTLLTSSCLQNPVPEVNAARPLPRDVMVRTQSPEQSLTVHEKTANKVAIDDLHKILLFYLKDRENFSSQEMSEQYNIQPDLVGMHIWLSSAGKNDFLTQISCADKLVQNFKVYDVFLPLEANASDNKTLRGATLPTTEWPNALHMDSTFDDIKRVMKFRKRKDWQNPKNWGKR